MKGAGSEIEKTRVIRGRNFASCDLVIARRLVGAYFREGRVRIATELAEHWQWRSRSGRLKVRAALAILVTLERGGHLQLPPPLIVHGPVRDTGDWACAAPPGTDLTDGLGQCLPLHWQLADSTEQRRQWRGVLARHHYLVGLPTGRPIGWRSVGPAVMPSNKVSFIITVNPRRFTSM